MDANNFREFGRAAIDFCADYLENIGERFVKYVLYIYIPILMIM